MQMVASSKMKKAQDKMLETRPYAQKILGVINHISNSHPEYRHPFMQVRDIKRAGYIIVSTDRGLCGALNAALFREVLRDLQRCKKENAEQDLCLIGNKAGSFFRRVGGNIVAQTSLHKDGHMHHLIGPVKVMVDEYLEGKLDILYLCGNQFVNTMTQKPIIYQLLPISSTDISYKKHYWDYLYEPDAKEILTTLFRRYIESLIYLAVVENEACEQSARMIAMKNATDNAGDIISDLELDFNKARQAAITREISEIVGGAAAIEG